jgi:hypothetical protein
MIEALTVRHVEGSSAPAGPNQPVGIPDNAPSVEVIMALPGLAAPPRHNYRRPLAPLAALGPKAPVFIQEWWHLNRLLGRSAMELFCSALNDRLFLENRLLNEMSFAESMHRVLHDEPPITNAEHETYTEAMLSQVPTRAERDQYKVREHYKVRLKYDAEQSQRQRLKWLLRRANTVFHGESRQPGALPDLDPELANRLVDTRNALTHLDPNAPQPLSDVSLYRALERLEVAIQTNLLLDLGLDDDEVASLMRASYVTMSPFIEPPNP